MADEKAPRPEFRYQDRPEISETFADAVGNWFFDGQTLRIEFTVSRLDGVQAADKPTGHKFPACRLVLPVTGALELLKLAREFTAVLQKAGTAKPPAEAEKTPVKAG